MKPRNLRLTRNKTAESVYCYQSDSSYWNMDTFMNYMVVTWTQSSGFIRDESNYIRNGLNI